MIFYSCCGILKNFVQTIRVKSSPSKTCLPVQFPMIFYSYNGIFEQYFYHKHCTKRGILPLSAFFKSRTHGNLNSQLTPTPYGSTTSSCHYRTKTFVFSTTIVLTGSPCNNVNIFNYKPQAGNHQRHLNLYMERHLQYLS